LRNLYNTQMQYNFTDLEVHHIEPIANAWDKRLEDNNLISLCRYHHELVEKGSIPAEELKNIILESTPLVFGEKI
uniref:HNH endonuclease n=1 Tax=Lysinibacillus sp. D4B2_S17 TaxID=2941225 RepID=UPI0020BF65E9